MTRSPLAAVTLLALVGTARPADEPPGPPIEWPSVKGLEKQKANTFKDAGLGYSVVYTGDRVVVTVFVYNLGLEKIPTGPNSDAVKAEMYEAALALEGNKASGRYKSIQPLDERVVPFGSNGAAPKLRRKRYEVDIPRDGPSIAELYMTGHKNYFIKLRTTYPVDGKDKHEKALGELIDGLGRGLK